MKSPPKGRNRCAKRDSTCTHCRQQALHQLFELIGETSPLTMPADSQRLLCSRLSRFGISHSVETLHLFMDIVLQSVQIYKRATTTFAMNLLNLDLSRNCHALNTLKVLLSCSAWPLLACFASPQQTQVKATATGNSQRNVVFI